MAAAVWRQGHLLHFGFDLSPEEMNERGQALLINSIVTIARFRDDRPITRAPDRALLRVGADRQVDKAKAENDYLNWYFSPAVRTAGKADDWPAFQRWYRENRPFLRADRKLNGSLVLDAEAKAFGVPPSTAEFFPAMLSALKEGGDRAARAAGLLRRYAPDGPREPQADLWKRWWEENRPYLFFSESGWYRWYIDPLARKRGKPTAELRGAARASLPRD